MKGSLTAVCKYCHETALKVDLHEDKYTGEFYHTKCAPEHKEKKKRNPYHLRR